MKTAAIPSVDVDSTTVEATVRRRIASDFAELVKARLTLLVLLTTAVGFYLGAIGPDELRPPFPCGAGDRSGRGRRRRAKSMVGAASRRAHAADQDQTHSRWANAAPGRARSWGACSPWAV